MIFVTVGTQLPFDRLIAAVDAWAGRIGRRDVLAQIGPSEFRPRHIESRSFLSPTEFSQCFAEAELVVAHAGMGTIISAMSQGKPILVMPRQATLHEQRNDHQLATARRMKEAGRILVAMNTQELDAELSRLDSIPTASQIGLYASPQLLSTVQSFLSSSRTEHADRTVPRERGSL